MGGTDYKGASPSEIEAAEFAGRLARAGVAVPDGVFNTAAEVADWLRDWVDRKQEQLREQRKVARVLANLRGRSFSSKLGITPIATRLANTLAVMIGQDFPQVPKSIRTADDDAAADWLLMYTGDILREVDGERAAAVAIEEARAILPEAVEFPEPEAADIVSINISSIPDNG